MSTESATSRPRIGLIHGLEDSVLPARAAFQRLWPEAWRFDLLDTSLSADLSHRGMLDTAMMKRFEVLADYASANRGEGGTAAGLLFTCSAFGPAIDAVKQRLAIPVLRPNEAAFDDAIAAGERIGLIVTFEPSLAALSAELEQMASAAGRTISIRSAVAEGALAALQRGDGDAHDRLAGEAAEGLGEVDVLVLGQFSLARAKPAVQQVVGWPVFTTPDSAVHAMRRLTGNAPA